MTKSNPYRNAIIAKIHIAKKNLAVEESSYRALLQRVTGKDSTKSMTFPELEAVLTEFKNLGFKAKSPTKAKSAKLADSAQARMIRGLWLDLRDEGELEDPSESALAKFVERQCGVSALEWLTPAHANKVINALRGWLTRVQKA